MCAVLSGHTKKSAPAAASRVTLSARMPRIAAWSPLSAERHGARERDAVEGDVGVVVRAEVGEPVPAVGEEAEGGALGAVGQDPEMTHDVILRIGDAPGVSARCDVAQHLPFFSKPRLT